MRSDQVQTSTTQFRQVQLSADQINSRQFSAWSIRLVRTLLLPAGAAEAADPTGHRSDFFEYTQPQGRAPGLARTNLEPKR